MQTAITLIIAASVVLAQGKPVTELSKKAAQLKRGMTKAEVITLLGPPTWARLPTDKGEEALEPALALELRWANGRCNNVVVSFDRASKVNGWDEGRALCLEKPYPYNPPDELSCKQKDRVKACRG